MRSSVRGIQPLQIVEEQRERVLLAREHAQEAPKNHLDRFFASCGGRSEQAAVSRSQARVRNDIDDQLTIWTERLEQAVPPPAEPPSRSG